VYQREKKKASTSFLAANSKSEKPLKKNEPDKASDDHAETTQKGAGKTTKKQSSHMMYREEKKDKATSFEDEGPRERGELVGEATMNQDETASTLRGKEGRIGRVEKKEQILTKEETARVTRTKVLDGLHGKWDGGGSGVRTQYQSVLGEKTEINWEDEKSRGSTRQ